MTPSEWEDQLRRARRGDAPVTEMRLRHWTVTRGQGRHRQRIEERWVALYPPDAEPGDHAVVVVPVRSDPALDDVEQGSMVLVWGWPVPGGGSTSD